MAETLLTPSSIKLYGRVMNSLQYFDDTATIGSNNFLQEQLSSPSISGVPFIGATPAPVGPNQSRRAARTITAAQTDVSPGMLITGLTAANPAQVFKPGTYIVSVTQITADPNAPVPLPPFTEFVVSSDPVPNEANCSLVAWTPGVSLARIYGFSFEGAYYSMPKPALLIVQGLGTPLSPDDWFGGSRYHPGTRGTQGLRSDMDQSGVAAREWEFSADNSLVYWEYEKGDFSLRLDTEAGTFEQLILAGSLRSGADIADRSGQGLGIRSGQGLDARSGQGLDIRSGQGLRTGR
jgi:hypothetical protein